MSAALPGGTVTFLLTDVEGSTRLWEEAPDAMRTAVARLDALVSQVVAENAGHLVKPRGEGDAHFTVFARASDAALAALEIQRSTATEDWPTPRPLRLRVGLHTGEAELRDDDYYGQTVNRAARIKAVGHGGQVVVSQATADLVRDLVPPDALLVDLGRHRLKDLAAPEHLWELRGRDAPAHPALRSLDYLPTNLPGQRTSFVGRQLELGRVETLLTRSRLVTLAGSGGCGKTRLALQVAADKLEEFESGAWFVDLAAVNDPELVPSAVAVAMGARASVGGDVAARVLEQLRPVVSLLVLDNCEHVIDAAARLVDEVLATCPGVRVIATSREPLGVDGEVVFRVPSLAPDDAATLFAERATVDAGEAVAGICRQLDGIPLAIELAAARARSLGVRELAARIDDLFRLLRGGSRTAVARQQTLEAAIDWSHDLLADEEQVFFRRLTVFAGGFTAVASEEVCGEGLDADPLDLLANLVDKSLVELDEAAGRYAMLESIRQYAAVKLHAAGETERLRDRHLDWTARLADTALVEAWRSGFDRWERRLAAELGNLRAAVEWARERGDLARAAQIAGDTGYIWSFTGTPLADDAELVAGVLALPLADEWRAYLTGAAAVLAFRRGDFSSGVGWTEQLDPAAAAALDEDRRLTVAHVSVLAPAIHADRDRAEALGRPLGDELRAAGLVALEIEVLLARAFAAERAGDGIAAQELLAAAASRAATIESVVSRLAVLLQAIGFASTPPETKRRAIADGLASARSRGEPTVLVDMLNAAAYMSLTDDEGFAFACAAEELEVARLLPNPAKLINAWHTWGELHVIAGRSPEIATEALEESARLAAQAGNHFLGALANDSLALLHHRNGELDAAAAAARAAARVAADHGALPQAPRVLRRFAEISVSAGDHERAAMLFGAVAKRGIGPPPPWEQDSAAAAVAAARAALGDDRWNPLFAHGETLDDEAALALVFDPAARP